MPKAESSCKGKYNLHEETKEEKDMAESPKNLKDKVIKKLLKRSKK